MRDILIHYYYGTDEKIIWDACRYDLKGLKKVLLIAIPEIITKIGDDILKENLEKRFQLIKKISINKYKI